MTALIRKGSALLMTLLLLLVLTACGAPQDNSVIGTWDYQFLSPGSFGGDGMMQHLTLTLREDNTFSFGPHEERMRTEIGNNIDQMMEYAIEQNEGAMTPEEFYAEMGVTREEMVEELLTSMIGFGSDGTYKLDGDKLFLHFEDTEENPEEYYTFAFEGGHLVLTLPDGVSPTFQIAPADQFPLTLTRGA